MQKVGLRKRAVSDDFPHLSVTPLSACLCTERELQKVELEKGLFSDDFPHSRMICTYIPRSFSGNTAGLCDRRSLHTMMHGKVQDSFLVLGNVRCCLHLLRISVYLSICLSVYLSICLSVYLSICLSVYLKIETEGVNANT